MPRFSPSGFFRPSRCLIPTPVLTSEYPHLCSVCVCVRIHTHTPTYTPTRVKNREDTENTPIFPSVKKDPPTPSNKRSHKLVEPPHPHSPMLNETNCTYMLYREIHVCIYTYIHINIYTHTNTHTHTHMYTPIHICIYMCIHTYIYIYIHANMYVYTYIYAYIHVYI